MERGQKIFSILAMAGLIAVLVNEHGKIVARSGTLAMREDDVDNMPTSRLGASTSLHGSDIGPAYLLANLPRRRDYDYFAPSVSCGGC